MSKNKTNQHLRFLACAEQLAEFSDVPRFKYGAVLVFNKTIISSGHNSTKTHPIQASLNKKRSPGKQNRSFCHAEVATLSKVRNVPEGSTLYITRTGGDGWQMARPCEACMELIKQKAIQRIVYTTSEGIAEEVLL